MFPKAFKTKGKRVYYVTNASVYENATNVFVPYYRQAGMHADEILANNPVPYVLSNDVQLIPIAKGRAINSLNGEIIEVYSLNSRVRTSEILHKVISQLANVCVQTVTVRGKDGEEFAINPATTSELQVANKDGQVVASLNSNLLLTPDSPEREAAMEDDTRKICFIYPSEAVAPISAANV